MSSVPNMVAAVKAALRARGMRYRDVADAIGLSEASVKRVFAEETFSLKRFEEICALVDLSVADVARMAGAQEVQSTLTLEQETALADDPALLTWFYLIINGWTAARIRKAQRASKARATKVLATLDRLGLVELLPGDRARPLTARNVRWRKDGPVLRAYEARAKKEFLEYEFEGADDLLATETAQLSDASIKLMTRKLARLRREFAELAELDLALPLDEKRGVGLMLAFRPWVFSLVAERTTKGKD